MKWFSGRPLRSDAMASCVLLAWCALACSSCGPGEILVQGKVTKGGAPLTMEKSDQLGVNFVPLEGEKAGQGESYAAKVNQADGSFIVYGIRRRGIPPGKYRIAVQVMPNRGDDRLAGKFSPAKSPIVRTITNADELVIDLDRPGE